MDSGHRRWGTGGTRTPNGEMNETVVPDEQIMNDKWRQVGLVIGKEGGRERQEGGNRKVI